VTIHAFLNRHSSCDIIDFNITLATVRILLIKFQQRVYRLWRDIAPGYAAKQATLIKSRRSRW
jgi:hypothetical protein